MNARDVFKQAMLATLGESSCNGSNINCPHMTAILAAADKYAEERESIAVERALIQERIGRLDIQCIEGQCSNCDSKRPILQKLEAELAALNQKEKKN